MASLTIFCTTKNRGYRIFLPGKAGGFVRDAIPAAASEIRTGAKASSAKLNQKS